jgi:CheY-like chemotaxis protein
MAPFGNVEIVPLSDVPIELKDDQRTHDNKKTECPVVLVVDDEPLVADTLAAILDLAGYQVVTAYGGLKVLELALEIRPALLISDVAMPEMNGIELAMAVVENLPDCGIVLFSGHATSKDLAVPLQAGYDFTLLSKPVHPKVILKHVSLNLRTTRHTKKLTHLSTAPIPDAVTESA